GIVRSVSENIVITDDFAESAGIDYTIDSIYTLTEKTDIESDSAVKNILTKQSIMDSFDSFLEIMNTMIVVLIVAAAVLGIVVLYNLGVMSFTERSREMATLKVVGFKDKKIRSLLVGQTVWTTLAGAIIGLPTGIGVLQILINMLANDYEMKMTVTLLTCVLSLLLTFGVSLLVSVMVARKNKYIDMVEALKGAE
ncbi:MAG TPA: ABC transporter permease, partial [Bacillota bacterium]|nr:ABC transporter permease [Bacillota bacterium]